MIDDPEPPTWVYTVQLVAVAIFLLVLLVGALIFPSRT